MGESKEYYYSLVASILNSLSLNISVSIESHFPGNRNIGGKYCLKTDTITMYLEEIKDQCRSVLGSEERLVDYFKVILAHELGHSEDRDLEDLAIRKYKAKSNYEKHQLALGIEENAWNYAKQVLPELLPLIQVIQNHSMKIYVNRHTG
ncbi:hypothetical protein [Guptibacillus algicola]|uniref:hypothetical protein n=1 Tax=Guptibacillus algicola TaxID=225844 RepID=UPI001CD4BD05|nr:hypothetical protein [Alkalihalobacillus algicola]MCA0986138.1 hypothetical protein [Alkalihalobacillus algicola]